MALMQGYPKVRHKLQVGQRRLDQAVAEPSNVQNEMNKADLADITPVSDSQSCQFPANCDEAAGVDRNNCRVLSITPSPVGLRDRHP